MFTIKHIVQTTGRFGQIAGCASSTPPKSTVESLYEAAEVTFHPENDDMGALQLRTGDVFIGGLWGGMAYVMNEHGKTVARYDLPESVRQSEASAAA